MKGCWRVRVEAPAELEDELVGRLFVAGSQGSWSEPGAAGRVRIHAFFAGPAAARTGPGDLALVLTGLAAVAVSAPEEVEDRDWLASWREGAVPIAVGDRFLVDPREPEADRAAVVPRGRILLRLPARTAFGVGSHESTRLLVELLEATDVVGRRVLDVGTGTGILAFAALHLGAREVVALDLDPSAALLLPQMMALNGLCFAAFAGSLEALSVAQRGATGSDSRTHTEGADRDADRRFDLALVNVVPAEIGPDIRSLAAALRPGAAALFSGILSASIDDALSRVGRWGFRPGRRLEAGEWTAVATELRP